MTREEEIRQIKAQLQELDRQEEIKHIKSQLAAMDNEGISDDEQGDMPQETPTQRSKREMLGRMEDYRHERMTTPEKAARYTTQAARNVAAGAGDIADFASLPIEGLRYGLQTGAHKIAPDTFKEAEFDIPNAGERIANYVDTQTGGYTKPRTKGERLVEGATRAVATLPVGGGIAAGLGKLGLGATKAAKFIKGAHAPTVANIGGAAGAGAGMQAYLEDNRDPGLLGSLVAGMAGGMGGAYAPRALAGVANKTAGGAKFALKAAQQNPIESLKEIYEGGKNLGAKGIGKLTGFDPERYKATVKATGRASLGQSSKYDFPTSVEMLGAKYPLAGENFNKLFEAQKKTLAKRAGIQHHEDLVNAVKNPKIELAREGAEAYHTAQDAAYNKLIERSGPFEKKMLGLGERAPADKILKYIDKEYKLGVKTNTQKKDFGKTLPGEIYARIEKDVSESLPEIARKLKDSGKFQEPQQYAKALQEARDTVSFKTFEELRKKVHTAMINAPSKSDEKNVATSLYKLFRGGKEDFIMAKGNPLIRKEAKEARDLWAQYKNKKDGLFKTVQKLTDAPDDTTAFRKLTGSDPKYLEVMKKALPQEGLRDLDNAIVVKGGKSGDTWSPTAWHSEYSSWSPDVRAKYLAIKPAAEREAYENSMNWIGQNKAKVNKLYNTSHTAHTAEMFNYIRKFGAAGVALAKMDPTIFLSIVAAQIGIKSAAHLMTDPKFLSRMNKVITASNKAAAGNHMANLMKYPPVKAMFKTPTIKEAGKAASIGSGREQIRRLKE